MFLKKALILRYELLLTWLNGEHENPPKSEIKTSCSLVCTAELVSTIMFNQSNLIKQKNLTFKQLFLSFWVHFGTLMFVPVQPSTS